MILFSLSRLHWNRWSLRGTIELRGSLCLFNNVFDEYDTFFNITLMYLCIYNIIGSIKTHRRRRFFFTTSDGWEHYLLPAKQRLPWGLSQVWKMKDKKTTKNLSTLIKFSQMVKMIALYGSLRRLKPDTSSSRFVIILFLEFVLNSEARGRQNVYFIFIISI